MHYVCGWGVGGGKHTHGHGDRQGYLAAPASDAVGASLPELLLAFLAARSRLPTMNPSTAVTSSKPASSPKAAPASDPSVGAGWTEVGQNNCVSGRCYCCAQAPPAPFSRTHGTQHDANKACQCWQRLHKQDAEGHAESAKHASAHNTGQEHQLDAAVCVWVGGGVARSPAMCNAVGALLV